MQKKSLESREPKKQINVFSDTLLSVDHLDTLKLGFEKVYNYGVTDKKNLYVTEGRDYTFIYYDEEAIKKVSGTVLAINCERDTERTTGRIKINPFIYNDKEKIKLESKYIAPFYIAIDNIQDAYDITEYEFSKGDSKVMLLGITATTVKCLVVNLKLIDTDFDHSIKEVNLVAGNTYKVQYYKDKEIKELKGILLKIEEVEVNPDIKDTFVRFNYNDSERMYYDEHGPIVTKKEDKEKEKFFKLPTKSNKDVLLTFDVGNGNIETIFVSTIRDIPSDVPVSPEVPIDKRNFLDTKVSSNSIYIYSKNAMHIYIRKGTYTIWPTDLSKDDLIGLYPSEYSPIAYHPTEDGNYTIMCEFKNGYKFMTTEGYVAKSELPSARLLKFIEKFNAYILKYYGAYNATEFLKFRVADSVLYLDINYGMIQKLRENPPVFIEDESIRNMFNSLILEVFNNNTKIQINDMVVYNAASLNGENIRKYLVTIMSRLFANISAMTIDVVRSTLVATDTIKVSNTDNSSLSTYTLNIGIIGGDQTYLKSCSAALSDIISINVTASGTSYGLPTYTSIPTITLYTSNSLKNYLNMINPNRRTAYNGITVSEFFNILKKLDIMGDSKPQYLSYYEDCLIRMIRADIGITKWLNRFTTFTHIINGEFVNTLGSKAFIVNRESGGNNLNKVLTTTQNMLSDGFKYSLMESYSYASKTVADTNYDIMSELATFNIDGVITNQKYPILFRFSIYTKEELEEMNS